MRNSTPNLVQRIAGGYGRVLKSFGAAAVSVAAAVGIAALIVYPLWWLATHEKVAYNIVFAGVAAAALIAVIVRAILVRRRRNPASREIRRTRPIRLKIAMTVVLMAAAYATAILYVHGLLAAAIPSTIVVLAAIGYVAGSPVRGRNGRRRATPEDVHSGGQSEA